MLTVYNCFWDANCKGRKIYFSYNIISSYLYRFLFFLSDSSLDSGRATPVYIIYNLKTHWSVRVLKHECVSIIVCVCLYVLEVWLSCYPLVVYHFNSKQLQYVSLVLSQHKFCKRINLLRNYFDKNNIVVWFESELFPLLIMVSRVSIIIISLFFIFLSKAVLPLWIFFDSENCFT